MSTVSSSPPPETWAGKSRNAKAQARHRAKRKAYIEQLEQTVSKLQTALALSTEDVSSLPTPQKKLRELQEENDTLRAELRKLQQLQSSAAAASSSSASRHHPAQMVSSSSAAADAHTRKRKAYHPASMDGCFAQTSQAFLGSSSDALRNPPKFHRTDARPALHVSSSSSSTVLFPQSELPVERQVAAAAGPSSRDSPPVHQPSNAILHPAVSFSRGPASTTSPILWSLSSSRQRSWSESSTSSISDPPYLAQAHTPLETSFFAYQEVHTSRDYSPSYDHAPKAEDNVSYVHSSDTSTLYSSTLGIPLGFLADPMPKNRACPDGSWSYQDIKMR